MRIDRRTARYVAAVLAALTEDPDAVVTTCICPECQAEPGDEFAGENDVVVNDTVRLLVDDHHVVASVDGWTAVVVGCEGYWVIDPASVGIDSPNWQDAADAAIVALIEDNVPEGPFWDELVCFWTQPHPPGSCGADRCDELSRPS